VVTFTVAGVPGAALTEHCGACEGCGDTEHANVTVSLNPLTAIRFRLALADEPSGAVAGVRVKAPTAKSGGVVSLNTVPSPLAPNKVVPYRLPTAWRKSIRPTSRWWATWSRRLLAHFGKEGVPETVIPKINQEMLAEMIGTTRSRVSFFMNRFRKLGFIDYHAGDELQVHSSLLNIVLHD